MISCLKATEKNTFFMRKTELLNLIFSINFRRASGNTINSCLKVITKDLALLISMVLAK